MAAEHSVAVGKAAEAGNDVVMLAGMRDPFTADLGILQAQAF